VENHSPAEKLWIEMTAARMNSIFELRQPQSDRCKIDRMTLSTARAAEFSA